MSSVTRGKSHTHTHIVDHRPPAERQYIKQVQETIRKDAKPPVSFLQALRIDLSRLLLGLSAAQRDLILLRCGVLCCTPSFFLLSLCVEWA